MSVTCNLDAAVTYADVDSKEAMLLPRVFKLLQEAAIAHANPFGAGTNALTLRGESWVLNRIEVEIGRYPQAGEALRVATWSTGIKSFKGYRDFRVLDSGQQTIARASSLWLYVSIKSKAIVRVPHEIAATFPVSSESPWQPELERRDLPLPPADATIVPVTLRYSDFDVNDHVNNAAYLDFLQTGLALAGRNARPRNVRIHFRKAIPPGARTVDVRIAADPADGTFSIETAGTVHAVGAVG